MGEHVLFATSTAAATQAAAWHAVAPQLELVLLDDAADAAAPVDAADIERITIAFFSPEVYPAHTARFMSVAMQAENLRWMHLFNAGTDHPVFAAFTSRGVRLTTSSGAAAEPIAHTVMMQLLALSRDARRWHRDQDERVWHPRPVLDLEERTLVVVGLGAIGSAVARLGAAFGMRVVGLRRTPDGTEPCETWPMDRLAEALASADDVVLTAPLTDDTRGMISGPQLAQMRPGAHLVNVGRGELIDEPALIESLRSGHLGGAALDVFAVEPLPADSPLWTMPNVLITPHSAGSTAIGDRRVHEQFTANLAAYMRGEPLRNEV